MNKQHHTLEIFCNDLNRALNKMHFHMYMETPSTFILTAQ